MSDDTTIIDGLTHDEISKMSPDVATAILAAMQAKHAATVDKSTPDGIRSMTPAEAAAALAERRPKDAEGKSISEAPFSGIESSEVLNARRAEVAITQLEEMHFPARGTPVGDDLWDRIDGKTPIEPGLQQKVEMKLKQFHADQAWVKRLMEGDPSTMREWHTACALLTACKIHR